MLFRDMRVAVRSVWKNLALFAVLLVGTAVLLQGAYPQASFLERLVDAFHLAVVERIVREGESTLPLALSFIAPLLTVLILGEGVVRVLSNFMARAQHREEWDRMVAKTLKNHLVICGVGELGRALVRQLLLAKPNATIVLVDAHSGTLAELGLKSGNLIDLVGDMTSIETLQAANCQTARMIILASGNDAFNLEAAFKALKLNPRAEVWVRLYRHELAGLLDAERRPNLHYFCPYDEAALVLANRLS